MTDSLVELCSILVHDAFGETASIVFGTFARKGRLDLNQLRRYSVLPFPRLRAAILTLVQHHIVYHDNREEYGDPHTYFQVDWKATYSLIRAKKLLQLVEDREGIATGLIYATFQRLGQINVGDLADLFGLTEKSKLVNGTANSVHTSSPKQDSGIHFADDEDEDNPDVGSDEDRDDSLDVDAIQYHVKTVAKLHEILTLLLKEGYLMKVTERDHLHPDDLDILIKDAVIEESFSDGKITGPKKSQKFKQELNKLKRQWQNEDEFSEHRDIGSFGEIKRPTDEPPSSKRRKTNGGQPNGVLPSDADEGEDDIDVSQVGAKKLLPNDMVLRVDHEKYVKAYRTTSLHQEAIRLLGPLTGAVYGALLLAAESDGVVSPIKEIFDDDDGGDDDDDEDDEDSDHLNDRTPSDYRLRANDAKVLERLNQRPDIATIMKDSDEYDKCVKKVNVNAIDGDDTVIKEEVNGEDDEGDPEAGATLQKRREKLKRLTMIDTHLHMLNEHDYEFCSRSPDSPTSNSPTSKYSDINYTMLGETLIGNELERMALARFGRTAHRVIRILRSTQQRLEEKTLSDWCWKDERTYMRPLLTQMHRAGFLATQEVPKDASRKLSMSVYLWFFDEHSVRRDVIEKMYFAQSRLLLRLRAEAEGPYQGVIEKVETYGEWHLEPQEKELLAKWKAVEAKFVTQLGRVDDLIALLRDFIPGDTTLLV